MSGAIQTNPHFEEDAIQHGAFGRIPRYVGEFWTAQQRQMHSLHYAVSYRASYKPELPQFFIERYSRPGDVVLDPFGGRGTTALQAALMGRRAVSIDSNPLSARIVRPKLSPVPIDDIEQRLAEIDFNDTEGAEPRFGMFYHPDTERRLFALRRHLQQLGADEVDRFIELIALSRLHGHSAGFFSVYSFPQISVPPEAQRRINEKRNQKPEFRDVAKLILRKARRVLRDGKLEVIRQLGALSRAITADARDLRDEVKDGSADLIVTSPPFLNKADYVADNWLEFWFCGIDPAPLRERIFITPRLSSWKDFMRIAMAEMHRILRPGGYAAIEVGEVVGGEGIIYLEEVLIDIAADLTADRMRLIPECVYIQQQRFTKLANCFGVDNNRKGTNTNRIVVFRAE